MNVGVNNEAVAAPQAKDTTQENIVALRKKMEAIEQQRLKDQQKIEEERKKREELENRLRSLSGVKDQDDDDAYNYVSQKDIKALLAAQQQAYEQKLKEVAEREAYERKNEQFFSTHNDFHEVVTEENIKKLEQYDPHFSSILALVPDKVSQLRAAYGKVKEMQQATQKQAERKGPAVHPYVAASPFGQGGVASASSVETMNSPQAKVEARKLLEQMKKGFFHSGA